MTENNSFWRIPIVYFITRLFILAGMMLVFGGMAYSVAVLTIPSFFGLDIAANPDLFTEYHNPQVVKALKWIQACSSIGLFIAPAWQFSRALEKEPLDFLKLNRKTPVTEIVLSVFIPLVFMPFISWLIYANSFLHLPPAYAQLEQTLKTAEEAAAQLTGAFLQADSLSVLVINLIIVALLPAIGEELFFRGALQNFVRLTFKNKHIAVWLVAMLFSAAHGQFYGFIPRLLLGAVLGYAYLYTGNLWLTVIMHFVNNAFAVICAYTPIKQQLPAILQDGYVFEAWYINTASALLGVLLVIALHKVTFKRVWYNGE